jgi:hypothetical protein
MSAYPVGYPLGHANDANTPRSAAPAGGTRERTVEEFLGGCTRLGRRGRARLRTELGARDRNVLHDVDRFRLLTSRQLELLHFAGSATPLTAARTARRVLRRLTAAGLLHRLERRVGGTYGGSSAYVYALTHAGSRLLDEGNGSDRPRRRLREPSLPFLRHTLAIAELYVELVVQERLDGDLALLDVQTEPSCWRSWTRLDGDGEVLRPDLYLALGVGEMELRWFVEVDLASEHLPALRRKCRAYQAYYDSGVEQTREGVFPRVLWVAPDERRSAQIERLVEQERGLTPGLFAVATAEVARERLVE